MEKPMSEWTKDEFLAYARANMNNRSMRQRMKQAGYDKWNEIDLANLLCEETTGYSLGSPSLDFSEKLPEIVPTKELPKEPPPAIPTLPAEVPAVEGVDNAEVDRLYREYLDRYDMPEPNDKFLVRQLCMFQVAMEKANRNYMKLLDTGESQNQLKAAADQLDKLTLRVSTMQRDLGIDKAGRGAEADSGEKLMEYARSARHILHRQGFPIICTACARGVDGILNQFGIVIWHFAFDAEWEFKFTCPRCGQVMTYNKSTVAELKRLMNWDK